MCHHCLHNGSHAESCNCRLPVSKKPDFTIRLIQRCGFSRQVDTRESPAKNTKSTTRPQVVWFSILAFASPLISDEPSSAVDHAKLVAVLVSLFPWWDANAQRVPEGRYDDGWASGTWVWWHGNGQRICVDSRATRAPNGTGAWTVHSRTGQLFHEPNQSSPRFRRVRDTIR